MTTAGVLLIGVDGGATEVKAHAVACDDLQQPRSFALRPESASRVYRRVPGFAPLPVPEQLAQRDAGALELSAPEREQGGLWVRSAAEAILEVARCCGATRLLVGIGMPGLKTADGRGINVINNGPRIPDYLDLLESRLAAAGVELVAPLAALASDADCCGLGEEYAADGLFRDVQSAYYVGCGTGIADALKVRGRLLPFDQARSWILKSWQMPSALGPTFEKLVSASAMNRIYAQLRQTTRRRDEAAAGHPHTRHTPSGYPERAALAGDPLASAWLDTAALLLAELIFERLSTVRNGRPDAPHRGEIYARLDPDHEYRGTLLDRVIIGQRLGLIYGDPACRGVFGDKVDAYLAAFIAGCDDAGMHAAYLAEAGGGERECSAVEGRRHGAADQAPRARSAGAAQLRPRFLVASKLRAAPALGAAVGAVRALSAPGRSSG